MPRQYEHAGHLRAPVLSLFLALLTNAPAFCFQARSAEEIAAGRQASINAILNHDSATSVAVQRDACAFGEEPNSVRKDRAKGLDIIPDAADGCVAALTRTAHDGNLTELYKKIVANLNGTVDPAKLPNDIGAAATHNQTVVAIGTGPKGGAEVTPALAFDAGFTVAYQTAAPPKPADAATLKKVTETCLDKYASAPLAPGACFAVGYVQGAQAYAKKAK